MTNQQGAPEALRLAEILEGDYCPDWFYEQGVDEVSAELRRQNARITELEAEIAAGGVQALSAAPAVPGPQEATFFDPIQAAADAASVGHLSRLLDHQSALLAGAMQSMRAIELAASPINESQGDFDARIPYNEWASFVESRAALLHDFAQSPVASPTPPAEQQAQPGAVDRTGCTAGTDEECTRRGCATSCPAQQAAPKAAPGESFQHRVQPWLLQCFGAKIAADTVERNHRFLEEALELVQSTGCTQSEAHQLVDYVFGRSVGDPAQEVGGVMVTLAALCLANGLDMHNAGEIELARIWTKVEAIRAKQAAKPKHSPLPQAAPQQEAQEPYPIDADPQGIRAIVADAITGALAFGAQGSNPPPEGHWLTPFWEMAREEAMRTQPASVSSDTLYLLRRLLSNQHTLTGSEFRAELEKIVGEAYQQEAQEPAGAEVFDGLPPLPDPEDLRDIGTRPQDLKDYLRGYATEYARLALQRAKPAPAPAELEQLKGRISRIGLDIDRALHGQVNEQSPVGAGRLGAIAALAAKPAPTPMSDDTKLLAEARAAIWQPSNAELCERIDAALAAQGGQDAG